MSAREITQLIPNIRDDGEAFRGNPRARRRFVIGCGL